MAEQMSENMGNTIAPTHLVYEYREAAAEQQSFVKGNIDLVRCTKTET